MIIVEENTTPQINMYLRDFTTESFEMEIISESERVEKVDTAISGSYDDFRKVLTFFSSGEFLCDQDLGSGENQTTFTRQDVYHSFRI
jgi:hypothetical protein